MQATLDGCWVHSEKTCCFPYRQCIGDHSGILGHRLHKRPSSLMAALTRVESSCRVGLLFSGTQRPRNLLRQALSLNYQNLENEPQKSLGVGLQSKRQDRKSTRLNSSH